MKTIIYSQPDCPGCDTVKKKWKAEGKPFKEIVIGVDISVVEFLKTYPNVRRVPHIVEAKED